MIIDTVVDLIEEIDIKWLFFNIVLYNTLF